MAASTSAVADQDPISVLFALHENFDFLDFAGPVEVFTHALHNVKDKESKAFDITLAGAEAKVLSASGVIVGSQISFKEAHERLEEFDMLVVVGGNVKEVLAKRGEPLDLVKSFSDLQQTNPARERSLLSICTGALFLADLGVLAGLSATTHPDYLTTFENLVSKAVKRDLDQRTDILEDARYVVNNLRFDLGDEDDNPYIRRKSDGRRPSNARKGSISLKGSNSREEFVARRAAMRLGGLRVVTAGGISAGIDAALYMVSAMVSEESAEEVARILQWTWTKGVVVDGLDV